MGRVRVRRTLRDVSSSGFVTSGPFANECTSTSILPKSAATASAVSFTVKAAAAAYRLFVRTYSRREQVIRQRLCARATAA